MHSSAIDDIKARINVVDLIGEYVRLQRGGANWKANCPFHNEKSPSFMVSEEKQIWHCFGCQKGGDIFGFMMEMEGMEFKEALKLLADKAGVKLEHFNPVKADEKKKTGNILELATKFYEKQLWDGAGKAKILPYLYGRGINAESVKKFRLGYAPDGWRNMSNFLTSREYALPEIIKTGLLVQKADGNKISSYDRFRDRIIFPIQTMLGEVVGYSARVSPGGDESQAKYVNTPETAVYQKSKVLYGIHLAKRAMKDANMALVVEGNMDVIACHQADLTYTVAVSGTALTEDHIKIIRRYTDNVKLFFDMDQAGREATRKSVIACLENGLNVYSVVIPQGKDAAELAKDNPQALRNAVENAPHALEYFFEVITKKYDKNKSQERKLIAKEFLNLVRHVADQIEQSFWLKKLAEFLEVEEKMLREIISKETRRETRTRADDEKTVVAKSRQELLKEKIMTYWLADAKLWKYACAQYEAKTEIFLELTQDALMKFLLEEGLSSGFSRSVFLANISDDAQREIFAAIPFSAAAYNMNSAEEGNMEHLKKEMMETVEEYGKEIRKKEMEMLEKKIKEAEKQGNKSLVRKMMEQFDKLSKQANNHI